MTEGELSAAGEVIVEMVEAERYETALGVSFGASKAEATAAFIRLSARYSAYDHVRIALNKARNAMQSETGLEKGVRLCRLDAQEDAVDCFQRAVTQNESLAAYRQLGRTLSKLGREEEALPSLEQAVEIGDEGIDYHWLGSSLAALGRSKEALPHLREAVRRRNEALDHEWLATTLLDLGRKAESLPHLRKVAELRGSAEEVHRLGKTLAELGEREAAVPFLEKAVAQRGSDVDCHWLGRTLVELGRNEAALPHLERAVSLCGDGVDHHWLGRNLAEMDQRESAIEHLDRAVEERGEPIDYHWLGMTLVDSDREEEAVPYLKLAVKEGRDPWDYRCLGRTLFNLGRHEEALACFEELIQLYGDAADHHWRRRVLAELGREDETQPPPPGPGGHEEEAGPTCANCGRHHAPSDKFCNDCGSPLPSSTGPTEIGASGQPRSELTSLEPNTESLGVPRKTVPGPPPQPGSPSLDAAAEPHEELPAPEAVPYASFVSLVLGSALLASMLVFEVADALARNQWEGTFATTVAVVGAILLARRAPKAWRRVVEAERENKILGQRRRRVLRASIVIILLFFTGAALVGSAIGRSGAEAVQLAVDLEQMATLGNRISKARDAAEATVASYVRIYKAIEPDVNELDPILGRLMTELGVYDGKFPAQHEQTAKSIANMEAGLRRMAILKQQIEVAKQIEALEPSQQSAAWRTQMAPLLANEDALDKAK